METQVCNKCKLSKELKEFRRNNRGVYCDSND